MQMLSGSLVFFNYKGKKSAICLFNCSCLNKSSNNCLAVLQGETILRTLAERSGKLSVRIAVNTPQGSQPQDDLRLLNDSGLLLNTSECQTDVLCIYKCWVMIRYSTFLFIFHLRAVSA